ncbi:hypothetical protein [Absidia glauca]|uniref:Uncharacterized protein n=1 Tax=Absidia glauca TaxID=4829 RepID=A0A168RQR9_ABSGL|nr:hypothetical protein [Absidia glauca]
MGVPSNNLVPFRSIVDLVAIAQLNITTRLSTPPYPLPMTLLTPLGCSPSFILWVMALGPIMSEGTDIALLLLKFTLEFCSE